MMDTFPAEEYGTGSRPTPLVDAPAWLKEASRSDRATLAPADRTTLAPAERAFLESLPCYEEPSVSLAPPPLRLPSPTRRVLSLVLFMVITSGACALLGLAVLRTLRNIGFF